jgi:HK97 gp10 family phage protein
MAPLRLVVVNADAVAKELGKFGPKAAAALEGVVKRGAIRIANRIVRTLQKGSRSGRRYPRGGGNVHVASAPGEPPKSDTGFLAKQVKPSATRVRGVVISSSVIISAKYSEFLEFGTSKMKARPFVRPAFKLEAPFIQRDAVKTLRRVL